MPDTSTRALKSGSVFRVLDDGTLVSVLDPSSHSTDMIRPLPKSSMLSSVPSPKPNSRDSFGILPSIPNPIRTISTLGGYVGGAVAAAPYTPFVLIGGGMSVVKGLSGMCEQWLEPSPVLEPPSPVLQADVQPAKTMNSQGIVLNAGSNVVPGMRRVRTSIIGDTMRVVSLIQDLVMLPLRVAASLRPIGLKANTIVDMVTSENVALTQIHQEVFTKNINNITKLALVGTAGAGGLMVICFMVAVAALVLGVCAIPLFWSLLTLVVFGVRKSKRLAKTAVVLDAQPPARLMPPTPPTPVQHLTPKSSRSFFL